MTVVHRSFPRRSAFPRFWRGAGAAALALGCGCGPSLAGDFGAETTEASAGSGSEDDPGASDDADATDGATDGADATDGPVGPADSSDEGPQDSSQPDDDVDSGDDDYTCGCDRTIVVELDEVVAEKMSAATVLQRIGEASSAWEWTGFDDSPTDTVLHLALTYRGGEILHGPDGEDGCAFLSGPCANTLLIPVQVSVSTDDGTIAASFAGAIDVDLDRYELSLQLDAAAPSTDAGGTLMDKSVPAAVGALTNLILRAQWQVDGTWDDAWLYGETEANFDAILLGSAISE